MTYITTMKAVTNINNMYRTYTFHPIRGPAIDDRGSAEDILTNNIDIPIMNHVMSHRGFKVECIINFVL